MLRGCGDQDWYNKIWSQFLSLNQYLMVSLLLLFIYFWQDFTGKYHFKLKVRRLSYKVCHPLYLENK
jgi:hypothetical protein